MQAAKLSGKGRVALPKGIMLLKSVQPVKPTHLDEVVGIVQHAGKTVSLEEMEEAIKQGALKRK